MVSSSIGYVTLFSLYSDLCLLYSEDLINSSGNSTVGKLILANNWGAATSPPPAVEKRICAEKDGRNGPECLSMCEEMEKDGRSGDYDDL